MQLLLQDLRYAIRTLVKAPVFSTVVPNARFARVLVVGAGISRAPGTHRTRSSDLGCRHRQLGLRSEMGACLSAAPEGLRQHLPVHVHQIRLRRLQRDRDDREQSGARRRSIGRGRRTACWGVGMELAVKSDTRRARLVASRTRVRPQHSPHAAVALPDDGGLRTLFEPQVAQSFLYYLHLLSTLLRRATVGFLPCVGARAMPVAMRCWTARKSSSQ